MKTLGDFSTALLVLLIINFPIIGAYAEEGNTPLDRSLEAKLEQLTTSVYCYCGCVRETVQQCVCGAAQGVEAEFSNRLKAGQTLEQIRNAYLAKYGTQYSAVMPAQGINVIAYVMPAIIIALIGGIVFLVLRSKRAARLASQSVSTEMQAPAEDNHYRQIEAELEHYKQQR